MTDMGQHLNNMDVECYEAPAMEILGSIADLTAGGTGGSADSCNAASFSISETQFQQRN